MENNRKIVTFLGAAVLAAAALRVMVGAAVIAGPDVIYAAANWPSAVPQSLLAQGPAALTLRAD